MSSSAARLISLCLTLSLLPGCAFLFTERLGRGHPREATPRCSASTAPLIVDGIFGAGFGFLAGIYYHGRSTSQSERTRDEMNNGIAVFGALASLQLLSAIVSYGPVKECARARDDHDTWLIERNRAPLRAPGAPPALAAPVMVLPPPPAAIAPAPAAAVPAAGAPAAPAPATP
jgi:hypothetical protein